jgi:hypothetical protein
METKGGPGRRPGPKSKAEQRNFPTPAVCCQHCPLRGQTPWAAFQRFKWLHPERYERIHRRPPIVHPCLVELERLCRAILIQGVQP